MKRKFGEKKVYFSLSKFLRQESKGRDAAESEVSFVKTGEETINFAKKRNLPNATRHLCNINLKQNGVKRVKAADKITMKFFLPNCFFTSNLGVNVMILKIFSPKTWSKMAILTLKLRLYRQKK
jgi:hypothetical protein